MSEAPKEVWCNPYLGYDYVEDWLDGSWSSKDRGGVKYVRADRIEELEAENKLLRDAVYIDDLTVTMQASDRSKAIATIGRALDLLGADMLGEAKTTLRTTLAELTGGKDE